VKLRIRDRNYDHIAAREECTLGDLMDLKRVVGIGKQTLERRLARFRDIGTVEDLFEDDELLEALIALAWLCKRHAGEDVTLAEVESLHYTDLEFVGDDGKPLPAEPEVDVPVPTVASGAEASRGKSNGGKSSGSGSKKLISTVS
jgi:hypothetical protein